VLDQVLQVNKFLKFRTARSLSIGLTGLTFLKLRMNQPVRRIHRYMVITDQCNSRLLSKSIVNNRAFSLDFCNFTVKTHRLSHHMPSRKGGKTGPILHPGAKGVGGSSHTPAALPEATRPASQCTGEFHDRYIYIYIYIYMCH